MCHTGATAKRSRFATISFNGKRNYSFPINLYLNPCNAVTLIDFYRWKASKGLCVKYAQKKNKVTFPVLWWKIKTLPIIYSYSRARWCRWPFITIVYRLFIYSLICLFHRMVKVQQRFFWGIFGAKMRASPLSFDEISCKTKLNRIFSPLYVGLQVTGQDPDTPDISSHL